MKTINVIRHLRTDFPLSVFEQDGEVFAEAGISNLGGITFLFELTFPESTDKVRGAAKLRYSYALCPENVNFNRQNGIAVAKAKMEAGATVDVATYDEAESLMFNAFIDLRERGVSKDPDFMGKKLFRLYNYMKKISERRQRIDDEVAGMIEQFQLGE